MDRRAFLNSSLAAGAVVAGIGSEGLAAEDNKVKILGISCSPRKGKTTATAIQVALNAAKTVSPRIDVELIDLGGLDVSGWQGGARPSAGMSAINDDFDLLLPKFQDPSLGGLIIGSPSYFRSLQSISGTACGSSVAKIVAGRQAGRSVVRRGLSKWWAGDCDPADSYRNALP
jgi:hypothetical protein